MYGSLRSEGPCQLALVDPDHACSEDCQGLEDNSISRKSLTGSTRARTPSTPSEQQSLEQRLLPLSDISISSSPHDGRMDLGESGKSWASSSVASGGPPGEINSVYHDFVGDPTFSIVSKDHTAEALRLCEKWILRPYKGCLRMIGWMPFSHSRAGRVAQAILVVLWTLAIMTAMITQILTCFRRDVFTVRVKASTIVPASVNETPPTATPHTVDCTDSIVSSLILPDLVLLTAYFFGVYLFSKGETEYLFRLASHVFIKNSESGNVSYNKRLIGSILAIFIAGVVWVFFSLIIRIISAIAGDLFDPDFSVVWPNGVIIHGGLRLFLVIFSLFGFFTFDLVYLFSVLNYAAQAEMNVYLLWDIASLIRAKKYDRMEDQGELDGAIKDIHECKRYLKVLSRRTATLTGLALFDLFNLAVFGVYDLEAVNDGAMFPIGEEYLRTLAAIAAGLNCVSWLVLVVVPFVQAARVTHACELLKDVGPEIRSRPFVYHNTPPLDLDSLLNYLQATRLRAAIFGVPIYPWMAYGVLVIFTFTMFILFQMDIFRSLSPYI